MKKYLVWRLVLSVILVCVVSVFNKMYNEARGTIEGNAAVLQLEDSDTSYVIGRSVSLGVVPIVITDVLGIVILFIWVSVVYSARKQLFNRKKEN